MEECMGVCEQITQCSGRCGNGAVHIPTWKMAPFAAASLNFALRWFPAGSEQNNEHLSPMFLSVLTWDVATPRSAERRSRSRYAIRDVNNTITLIVADPVPCEESDIPLRSNGETPVILRLATDKSKSYSWKLKKEFLGYVKGTHLTFFSSVFGWNYVTKSKSWWT